MRRLSDLIPYPRRPAVTVRAGAGDEDLEICSELETLAGGVTVDSAGWSPQFVCRIAYLRGDAAGYLLSDPAGPFRRVYRVVVLPEYRRLGVGRALVEHAQAAVTGGVGRCRGLDAAVPEADTASLVFLRRCGFLAVSHDDKRPDGPRISGGKVRLRWLAPVCHTDWGM